MRRQRSSLVETARVGARSCRQGISLILTALALTLVAIAIILVGLILIIVVAPCGNVFVLARMTYDLGGYVILALALPALYLCCVVGWPYLTAFWLGPSSPEAVAVGHCVCFVVLILTLYVQLLGGFRIHGKLVDAKEIDLRDEERKMRENEITHLESCRFWYMYIVVIFVDWYQYSALSFSTPDLKFPPSVQDLLDVIFSLGLFELPFLRSDLVVMGAFIAANVVMLALPVCFLGMMVPSILKLQIASHMLHHKSLIHEWKSGSIEKDFSEGRYNYEAWWRKSAALLSHKFPRIGPAVVSVLEGAHWRKLQQEFEIGMLFFAGCLVSVASANLRLMACRQTTDGSGHMMLVGDSSFECWTPGHSALVMTAGVFLMAFMPVGLLAQAFLASGTKNGITRHLWHLMLEQPLKLLTVGVAIQSEALQWTRARLIVTSASAAGIALASTAFWSTNHAGLNGLRQLAWWSACINSTSSLLHVEANNDNGYVALVCFLVGHALLATGTFLFNSGRDRIFMCPSSMRMLRRCTRLFILLAVMVAASTAGILPQLLSVNTGAYLERDLQISGNYTVAVDACAIFVRTTNCSACSLPPEGSPRRFEDGVVGGRVKVWGIGSLYKESSNEAAIGGTELDSCELWLLLPSDSLLSIHCRIECTLHAEGVFVGTSELCLNLRVELSTLCGQYCILHGDSRQVSQFLSGWLWVAKVSSFFDWGVHVVFEFAFTYAIQRSIFLGGAMNSIMLLCVAC